MPDLEDKEGEVRTQASHLMTMLNGKYRQTALHKAALNGHISIVQYLLPELADVQAQDADGWTALHNACSKVSTRLIRPFYGCLICLVIGLSGYRSMAMRAWRCHHRVQRSPRS